MTRPPSYQKGGVSNGTEFRELLNVLADEDAGEILTATMEELQAERSGPTPTDDGDEKNGVPSFVHPDDDVFEVCAATDDQLQAALLTDLNPESRPQARPPRRFPVSMWRQRVNSQVLKGIKPRQLAAAAILCALLIPVGAVVFDQPYTDRKTAWYIYDTKDELLVDAFHAIGLNPVEISNLPSAIATYEAQNLRERDGHISDNELLALCEKAAESGDARFQYLMGVYYRDGYLGLGVDVSKAKFWLEQSSDQGFRPARQALISL